MMHKQSIVNQINCWRLIPRWFENIKIDDWYQFLQSYIYIFSFFEFIILFFIFFMFNFYKIFNKLLFKKSYSIFTTYIKIQYSFIKKNSKIEFNIQNFTLNFDWGVIFEHEAAEFASSLISWVDESEWLENVKYYLGTISMRKIVEVEANGAEKADQIMECGRWERASGTEFRTNEGIDAILVKRITRLLREDQGFQ